MRTQASAVKLAIRALVVLSTVLCGGTTSTSDAPDLKVLHAKIGLLARENAC